VKARGVKQIIPVNEHCHTSTMSKLPGRARSRVKLHCFNPFIRIFSSLSEEAADSEKARDQ